MLSKKLWIFPLLFGVIGSLIGLILRYAFTGNLTGFPFKYFLHAHSHVMLLGFLFNALLTLIWINFTKTIDKISYRYYIAMQFCMAIMLIAFLLQGYAVYSILFSTLHLWISYILLIRLWKRLEGSETTLLLLKIGIFFHFLSSLGPYALGPLMVLDLKSSPWYQQSIFFYLHFQFFGVYFTWFIALLAKKAKINLSKNVVIYLAISMIFLFSHSLDYSFDHWIINFTGAIGAILLFLILLRLRLKFLHLDWSLKVIYYITLTIAIINIAGSFPYVADLLVNNRFVLIAWLHFLFLGLYVPFIWIFMNRKIHFIVWLLYAVSVLLSELFLVFTESFSNWFSVSIMDLLFLAYLGIFLSMIIVHSFFIFQTKGAEKLNKV